MNRLALALAALLLCPGRGAAEPSAVCSPTYPISANDVEIRFYGAEWCGACAATADFFRSIGATDTTPVTIDGRSVNVRLTHLDIDRISPADRAALQSDSVPEIHLVVRHQTVFFQAGAITSRDDLDRFVRRGLATGGCVLERAPRPRR